MWKKTGRANPRIPSGQAAVSATYSDLPPSADRQMCTPLLKNIRFHTWKAMTVLLFSQIICNGSAFRLPCYANPAHSKFPFNSTKGWILFLKFFTISRYLYYTLQSFGQKKRSPLSQYSPASFSPIPSGLHRLSALLLSSVHTL